MKSQNSQILKSISIFGGLQLFLMIINLVKIKTVALFIGVGGVAHFTMFNNILNLIVQFSFFGLNFSAVRSISLSFEQNRIEDLTKTNSIFRTLTIICGIFGLLITLAGSSLISNLSFDSDKETYSIMILAIAVLFTVFFNGNTALLQGVQQLKYMAKSSFFSALFGIIISVPLFYYFKLQGIIYSILITAILSYGFSYVFVRKTGFKIKYFSIGTIWQEGNIMIKLGAVMMASTLIGTIVVYSINVFILKTGSVEDLGLFSAGNSITNQYVGLIFTAMAADYFPKLSAISNDITAVNNMVNNQGEILLIIVCPILLLLISFSPLVIQILLSEKFLAITTFIGIMSVAMIFKTAAFPIGYISFAKGDKKTFFLFEGILNSILILVAHTVGFFLYGLTGIAIGVLLLYFTYFVLVNILAKRKYGFVISKKYLIILLVSFTLLSLGLLNFILVSSSLRFYLAIPIVLFSIYYSYRIMDEKIALKDFILNKLNIYRNS